MKIEKGFKGVGYCTDFNCKYYLKENFLLNCDNDFRCKQCKKNGRIKLETRIDHAVETPENAVYKLVKVHFNFTPEFDKYINIATVEIPEMRKGSLYEIYTPLVKTEKRALKIAETTLCLLNTGIRGGPISELVVDISKENWLEQIKQLKKQLFERERRVLNALR